jgi:hypothetical protein
MLTHHFVSQNYRVRSSEITIGYMKVRVADPAGQNPDDFLTQRERFRDLPVHQFKRRVRAADDY